MHPYIKKDTIFASNLYGIYNGSPCKSHTDWTLILYLLRIRHLSVVLCCVAVILISYIFDFDFDFDFD